MASVAVAVRGPSLLTSTLVIAKQRVFKVVRTPALFWTYTMQGVLFLVLFRYIFGGAIGAAAGAAVMARQKRKSAASHAAEERPDEGA